MREIKFRAWEHETEMGKPGNMSHDQDFCHSQILHNDGIEIMQFAGLKDCSNRPVDIYEGDIIKVTHFEEDTDHEDMVSEVIFESGVFALKQRHIDEGEVCPLSCEEHYVVIGNVFENPELLGAK